MIPVKLSPAFKDYIWGGSKLKEQFHKRCDFDRVAESWELSCHKDGNSLVASGPDTGLTLNQYIEKAGKRILGSHCEKFEQFPMLIKLIDARDNLSIQVHPDNNYALNVEGEYGKTEMWYIVDCEPNAALLYGFSKSISKEEFKARISDNTLLEVLNRVPVKKGDVFFIEAGTLHAIGKGIIIAEIQQNSNSTYRVYDYGRIGVDGKPRPLHVEKAVDVTVLTPPSRPIGPAGDWQKIEGGESVLLGQCDYFTVYQLNIDGKITLTADTDSFHSLLCLEGEGQVICQEIGLDIMKGDTVFVPAGLGTYQVSGKGTVILSKV